MSLRNAFGLILLVGLAMCLQADSTHAAIIQLDIFTSNGVYADDPLMDMYVEVSEDGDQVRFVVHNDSGVASSIAEIYFDDEGGVLLGIAENGIISGPGTLFSEGGSPPNLPAGNDLIPVFQKPPAFMASADNPAPANGINATTDPDPDEWVAIVFDLVEGNSISDVMNNLADESLRIGVHVIAFPDGSSESASTGGEESIPEPATLAVLLAGAVLVKLRRKRS